MTINLDRPSLTDSQLIARHLDGDRDAFRQIVERHQAMVCALGLSACGEVARSEDLAQEVFIVAWKQLPELREPEKLRGWLAGITRNLINNSFRRQARVPTDRAEELSVEMPAATDSPREQAISADEASLMWQALAGIPENYREPMVLFYREERSVTAVAAALEISEEAVRQRLVRGRAMLTERMAKLVEETLERSAPTPLLAGAVMLALPLGVTPTVAKAAMVAVTGGSGGVAVKALTGVSGVATKGGAAAKILSIAGFLPFIVQGVVEFLRFRTNYETQESNHGRRRTALVYLSPKLLLGLFFVGLGLLHFSRRPGFPLAGQPYEHFVLCVVALLVVILLTSISLRRWQKRLEVADDFAPEGESQRQRTLLEVGYEYRSRQSFLGLPLVHIHVGGAGPVMKRTARGWIAVTDGIAIGTLFGAGGQFAIAPVSAGVAAIGFLSVGFMNLGIWAAGFIVGGFYAWGMVAYGWIAAKGGMVISSRYAVGRDVLAPHANDEIAQLYIDDHFFFRFAETVVEVVGPTLWFAWLPSLLLIGWYLWRKRGVRSVHR